MPPVPVVPTENGKLQSFIVTAPAELLEIATAVTPAIIPATQFCKDISPGLDMDQTATPVVPIKIVESCKTTCASAPELVREIPVLFAQDNVQLSKIIALFCEPLITIAKSPFV